MDALLSAAATPLLADQALPRTYRDHPLSGNWAGYRECHLKPDLLMIYKSDPYTVRLARLGSHSEPFG